jgi:hypothetical protein
MKRIDKDANYYYNIQQKEAEIKESQKEFQRLLNKEITLFEYIGVNDVISM